VTDENNKPLRGIGISAYPQEKNSHEYDGYANTNEDGTYKISGLKDAAYKVQVNSGRIYSSGKGKISE